VDAAKIVNEGCIFPIMEAASKGKSSRGLVDLVVSRHEEARKMAEDAESAYRGLHAEVHHWMDNLPPYQHESPKYRGLVLCEGRLRTIMAHLEALTAEDVEFPAEGKPSAERLTELLGDISRKWKAAEDLLAVANLIIFPAAY
jgi:hypothetical protein